MEQYGARYPRKKSENFKKMLGGTLAELFEIFMYARK